MILDDYDIVSLESNICAAEYAMESAKYEIDNGNREFAVVYEAASASVNNSANSWIDKVKSKISAILEKIRIALTKFSMRARLKKNTRQIKAFKKKIDTNSDDYSNLRTFDKTYYSMYFWLNGDIKILEKSSVEIYDNCKSLIDNGAVSKASKEDAVFKTFYRDIYDQKYSYPDNGYVAIGANDLKQWADQLMSISNKISDSLKKMKDNVNKLQSEGYDLSKVRKVLMDLFNININTLRSCVGRLEEYIKFMDTGDLTNS